MRLRSTLLRLAMLGAVAAFAACGSDYEDGEMPSITGPEIAAIQADAPAVLDGAEQTAKPTEADAR